MWTCCSYSLRAAKISLWTQITRVDHFFWGLTIFEIVPFFYPSSSLLLFYFPFLRHPWVLYDTLNTFGAGKRRQIWLLYDTLQTLWGNFSPLFLFALKFKWSWKIIITNFHTLSKVLLLIYMLLLKNYTSISWKILFTSIFFFFFVENFQLNK